MTRPFAYPLICAAGFGLLLMMVVAPTDASATDARWQCVTFARSYSGINIRGNAHTWWAQAARKYHRSSKPDVGDVLVLKSYGNGGMRLGHVATVSKIVSEREILVTPANWTGSGQVESNVRTLDVSANNDWSQVRVWYAPINALGKTSFPAFGFIKPRRSDSATVLAFNEPSDTTLKF